MALPPLRSAPKSTAALGVLGGHSVAAVQRALELLDATTRRQRPRPKLLRSSPAPPFSTSRRAKGSSPALLVTAEPKGEPAARSAEFDTGRKEHRQGEVPAWWPARAESAQAQKAASPETATAAAAAAPAASVRGAAEEVRAHLAHVGLTEWTQHLEAHLPARVLSLPELRGTTAAELQQMASRAGFELPDPQINEVLRRLGRAALSEQPAQQPEQRPEATAHERGAQSARRVSLPGLGFNGLNRRQLQRRQWRQWQRQRQQANNEANKVNEANGHGEPAEEPAEVLTPYLSLVQAQPSPDLRAPWLTRFGGSKLRPTPLQAAQRRLAFCWAITRAVHVDGDGELDRQIAAHIRGEEGGMDGFLRLVGVHDKHHVLEFRERRSQRKLMVAVLRVSDGWLLCYQRPGCIAFCTSGRSEVSRRPIATPPAPAAPPPASTTP